MQAGARVRSEDEQVYGNRNLIALISETVFLLLYSTRAETALIGLIVQHASLENSQIRFGLCFCASA